MRSCFSIEPIDRCFDLFGRCRAACLEAPKNFMYEFSFNMTSCQGASTSYGLIETLDKLAG